MKILVNTIAKENEANSMGVIKKVLAQVKAFCNLNNETYYSTLYNNNYRIYRGEDHILIKEAVSTNRVHSRLLRYREMARWCVENKVDLIYVRADYFDAIAYVTYRKLRRYGIKIICEIPTYPFEGEVRATLKRELQNHHYFSYVAKSALFHMGNYFYSRSNEVFDLIVIVAQDMQLFNTKTVAIENGVDMDSVPLRKHHSDSEKIIYLIIANVTQSHGVDRFIEGINKCRSYKGYTPELWIVGPVGDSHLHQLVSKYELDDYVKFLGPKFGEELEQIKSQADTGIAALGMHRVGLTYGSLLKVREYCACGLPFIYAYEEKALTGGEQFALRLPANESPVDMEAVMRFSIETRNNMDLHQKMREFAAEKYDWQVIMKRVLEACPR